MKNHLNAIPDVEVTPMNMFELNELRINKELIAYIRFNENKAMVFPHFNYASKVGKPFYANTEQMQISIEKFKRKKRETDYPCFS
ncbi:hypothetical protein EBB07_29300 [Paenibacillaceae bacterium]|nr:hypothetical protein EBB07_29300 [Paenibacillaceae bacterium]